MYDVTAYNDKAVKDICYNCGSKVAKQSYNYFRRMHYVTGGKVWSKGDTPIAFYYASRCRDHVRLIEIAVLKEFHRQGLGKMALFDLLKRMKRNNIYRLTFRTPMNEEAQQFWLHIGARITDVKRDDYEMELTIN
jgi:GNAT superfamily N-acetyltransferase